MKLGLGTAQLGMNYGISNQNGIPFLDEVKNILAVAAERNIRTIDTAAVYGTSESVLGTILTADHPFHIVTKTPDFSTLHSAKNKRQSLVQNFEKSLQKLKQQNLYGVLVHNADDLLTNDGQEIFDELCLLKERGAVKKIGASVYTSYQIDNLMEKYPLDLIQIPINILDQRLLQSGHLKKLKKLKVEIHARSVFLQGLLLMDIEKIPAYFNDIKDHLSNYHDWLFNQSISRAEAALGFVSGLEEIDVIIVGITQSQELIENIRLAKPLGKKLFEQFALNDELFLNPSKWKI